MASIVRPGPKAQMSTGAPAPAGVVARKYWQLDKTESRVVRLNFSYKFGNKNVKASPRRNTGTEAEKARMDN